MKKIIIHTERIIPDEEYLQDWFIEMKKSEIPTSVLEQLKESGDAVWETKDGPHKVTTMYRIKDI